MLTERIIGLAIKVHRNTGPGLLELVYGTCLCHELQRAGLAFQRQAVNPVLYKDQTISFGFRADIVVGEAVIVEVKAVAALTPAHDARLMTYLRMSRYRISLLMNFHAPPRRWTSRLHRVTSEYDLRGALCGSAVA